MKLIVTMNQIGYFKPETTARRLKTYYHWGEGNPVVFLGYLRLIRLLSELAERITPLRPELYAKEVREIYLTTDWEQRPYLVLFLREFRGFFTEVEWHELRERYQALYPFLAELVVIWDQLWMEWVRLMSMASVNRYAVLSSFRRGARVSRSP